MTSIAYLCKYDKYKKLLINLILKSGGRYVLSSDEIDTILKKYVQDSKIYNVLRKLTSIDVQSRDEIDYINSRKKRANIRYDEICKIPNLDIDDAQRYLDFGAGDCSMAVLLGRKFGAEIYAIDIHDWGGSLNDPGLFKTQCKYKKYDGFKIPFKDSSFDLITALQVLHHIESIEITLAELYRILCIGGIFIIREHNCHNNKMRKLVEVEHELHNKVFNKTINEKEAYSKYRRKDDLRQMILNVGFKYIGQYCMNDPIWNPTRYYYQAFRK